MVRCRLGPSSAGGWEGGDSGVRTVCRSRSPGSSCLAGGRCVMSGVWPPRRSRVGALLWDSQVCQQGAVIPWKTGSTESLSRCHKPWTPATRLTPERMGGQSGSSKTKEIRIRRGASRSEAAGPWRVSVVPGARAAEYLLPERRANSGDRGPACE